MCIADDPEIGRHLLSAREAEDKIQSMDLLLTCLDSTRWDLYPTRHTLMDNDDDFHLCPFCSRRSVREPINTYGPIKELHWSVQTLASSAATMQRS